MNFFDGIDREEALQAATRALITVVSITFVMFLFEPVNNSEHEIDTQMNSLYETAQDSELSADKRIAAMNQLSALQNSKSQTNLFQIILSMSIFTLVSLILAGLSCYLYTNIRFTKQEFRNTDRVNKQKVLILGMIFTTVFAANAIIYLAEKL